MNHPGHDQPEGAAYTIGLPAEVLAYRADPARRAEIVGAARAVEAEPSLLGLSAHVMAVGRRP